MTFLPVENSLDSKLHKDEYPRRNMGLAVTYVCLKSFVFTHPTQLEQTDKTTRERLPAALDPPHCGTHGLATDRLRPPADNRL